MVRIAIADNNRVQRDVVVDMLKDLIINGYKICYESFSDGKTLIDSVKKNGFYDIYILDVFLPGINGFEVATTLRYMHDKGKIIFLTLSVEYAALSYDVDAFYYMIKPANVPKLTKILEQAIKSVKDDDIICVETSTGKEEFPARTLVYAELIDRRVRYYLSDGRAFDSITIRKSFKNQTMLLGKRKGFVYLGVSFLVNLTYVEAINNDMVTFRNGLTLIPPKSSYKDLKIAWMNFKFANN